MSQILDAVVEQIRIVITEEQNGGRKVECLLLLYIMHEAIVFLANIDRSLVMGCFKASVD